MTDHAPAHGHTNPSGPRSPAERVAAACVAAALALSLVSVALLWPGPLPERDFRPDAAQRAQVTSVQQGPAGTLQVTVVLLGQGKAGPPGSKVTVETFDGAQPTLAQGDRVKVIVTSLPALTADGEWEMAPAYQLIDFDRSLQLWLLVLLFAGSVVAVGGRQGLRALAGLSVSLAVVIGFVVPAILSGRPPVPVAVAAGALIMILTLHASHGRGPHVTAAALGTLSALAVTAGLGVWFVQAGRITGLASEHAYAASVSAGGLDLTGLVLAGLIIATLGVLDDVAVAQASTVWALKGADPTLTGTQLFTRAMVVGRDHIAAVVNTLFLAYTGASLALLILFHTSGLPAGEIVSSEAVAEEIVKTLVGSVGLTLAVPMTTALAALLTSSGERDAGSQV